MGAIRGRKVPAAEKHSASFPNLFNIRLHIDYKYVWNTRISTKWNLLAKKTFVEFTYNSAPTQGPSISWSSTPKERIIFHIAEQGYQLQKPAISYQLALRHALSEWINQIHLCNNFPPLLYRQTTCPLFTGNYILWHSSIKRSFENAPPNNPLSYCLRISTKFGHRILSVTSSIKEQEFHYLVKNIQKGIGFI